jgi:hypothetical protein
VLLLAQVLTLLIVANGAPLLAERVMGKALSYPVDGRMVLADGRPLLGPSKTVRGIVVSLVATLVAAPLIGLHWSLGLAVAALAMAGDLLSSFLKRRMGLAPSSQFFGLDQIPEALLPLIACSLVLPLDAIDVLIALVVFVVGAIIFSRVLFKLQIRERTY